MTSQHPPTEPSSEVPPPPSRTGEQTYKIVSDTVIGVNVRGRDNLLQALVIVTCLVLGAGLGLLVASDRKLGAMIGAALGMVAGLLGSGGFLMVYRLVRHARGQHD